MIYIYQDYVHNNGVLYNALCDVFAKDKIHFCDAEDILNGCLNKAKLMIMPGGADLYYCEKLNGSANKIIKDFVENGGSYLGICAGAYYGCKEIDWAKNKEQQISGSRELSFYDGTATGPIYELIEDQNIKKSWSAAPNIRYQDKVFPVYYEGGPVFTNNDEAKIIARYDELAGKPAAIIELKIGDGTVILCSPHLEYKAEQVSKTSYKHQNSSHEHKLATARKLSGFDEDIENLWTDLLSRAVKGGHEKASNTKKSAA